MTEAQNRDTEGMRSQFLEPVHCGDAQLSRQELLLAMTT